jgi:hypothetical protein
MFCGESEGGLGLPPGERWDLIFREEWDAALTALANPAPCLCSTPPGHGEWYWAPQRVAFVECFGGSIGRSRPAASSSSVIAARDIRSRCTPRPRR